MAGAAAVVDNRITKLENHKIFIDTNLKALGVLGREFCCLILTKYANNLAGLYISTLPGISWKDALMITVLGKVIPVHTVSVSKADEHVLEIDVERAWKELELESGWSNEVEVKIYISPSH